MEERYITNSETETMKIAKAIFDKNKDKNLILLYGDLGAGKTVFVKGLAKALKIKENVTSPTFGIKNNYDGLVHYDLYLANKTVDISLLLDEDMEDNLVVVEWSEKLPKKCRIDALRVYIKHISETEREIVVE